MDTDRDSRHWLQVLGVQHNTRHLQGVDRRACREGKREILEYVSLIIVGNGIGEIDRIGRILQQGIFQLNRNPTTVRLYYRL